VTGGQYQVLGPPDSFLEGNTNIGLALVMVIPLILALREEQTNPTIRKLLVGVLVLSVIACVGTYSRGAVLGLVVSMGLLVLKGKAKAVVLPLIIGGALLAPYILPEKWFGRMETIKTYEQESSAVSRLRAWEMAYNLAMDRPLLGGGFETFSVATYQRYLSDERLSDAVIGTGAHSIFFQVLGEHGFTGLFLFAALLMTTFSSLRKVIRQSKENESLRWIHNYAHMIQLSLAGFTVSGLFLSMCYFDLYYQLIALTVVLRRMCQIQPAAAPDSLAIRQQTFGGDVAPATS
jgi:probable O-glycosylation ligase (exosortase A-associated)